MTLKSANLLKQAADKVGLDLTIRDNYSGRGMYGRETTAVILDSILLLTPIHGQAYIDLAKAGDIDGMEELLDDLTAIHYDNMGRDIVVY